MIARGIITGILMLALTLVSFGHRTLSPQTEAQAEAYILAGGDWSELCGEGSDPFAHTTKCMACVIGQTCAIPNPSDAVAPQGLEIILSWANPQEIQPIVSAHALQSARAPPFHLV